MKINRDVYKEENDVKLPDSTPVAYRNASIISENFQVNKFLDSSPTYMKVKHEDNLFNHIGYIGITNPKGEIGELGVVDSKVFETPNNEYDNLMLMYQPAPLLEGTRAPIEPLYFNGNSKYEWGTQCETPHTLYPSQGGYGGYYSYLITRFEYRNVRLSPQIFAYDENFSTLKDFSLQAWDVINYPNVVYIAVNCNLYNVFPVSPLLIYGYSKALIGGGITQNNAKSLLYSAPMALGTSSALLFGTFNYTVYNTGNPILQYKNYVRPDYNIKIHNTGTGSIIYSDKITKDVITEWMNNLGLIWSSNNAFGSAIDSPFTHIPNINDDGELTGGNTSGEDNKKQPQYNWSKPDDVFEHNNVTPTDNNTDQNTTTDKTPLNIPNTTPLGVFNSTYVTNGVNVKNLANELWTKDDDWITQFIDSLKLMGDNPLESIINIRFYPFEISSGTNLTAITIGKTVFDNVQGEPIKRNSTSIIDLGDIFIEPKYNSFLDYPPYTNLDITFPFLGTLQIDTSVVMGKHINAKYIVDYLTGVATGVVFCNDIIIGTISGQIGIDVAITSSLSADFSNKVINTIVSNFSGVGGSITPVPYSYTESRFVPEPVNNLSATSGSSTPETGLSTWVGNNAPLGNTGMLNTTISGAGRLEDVALTALSPALGIAKKVGEIALAGVKSAWEIANIPLPVMSKGNSSPMTALYLPQYAYCTIRRPITMEPENYGHKFGYACFISDYLSNVSGFTVCENPELNFNATETEKAEIIKFLTSGIVI